MREAGDQNSAQHTWRKQSLRDNASDKNWAFNGNLKQMHLLRGGDNGYEIAKNIWAQISVVYSEEAQ